MALSKLPQLYKEELRGQYSLLGLEVFIELSKILLYCLLIILLVFSPDQNEFLLSIGYNA